MQQKLYQLYLVDKKLYGLQSHLDAATRRQRMQSGRLSQLTQQREELAQQLKQIKVAAAALEHQAAGMEQRIGQLREQMNTVKNNREYSAILVEVNTLKVDKGKLEDEALEHLGRVDALTADVSQKDTQIEAQKKVVVLADGEVAKCQSEIGEELDQLKAERDQAVAELPLAVRVIYERAAAANEDGAMAEVVEENRRRMEYSCGGCYLAIPVELLNTLLGRADKPVLCPSCTRILYVQDALRESFSDKTATSK